MTMTYLLLKRKRWIRRCSACLKNSVKGNKSGRLELRKEVRAKVRANEVCVCDDTVHSLRVSYKGVYWRDLLILVLGVIYLYYRVSLYIYPTPPI